MKEEGGVSYYKTAVFPLKWKRYDTTKLKELMLSLVKRVYHNLFIEIYTGPIANIHEASNLICSLNLMLEPELSREYPLKKVMFLFPDVFGTEPILKSAEVETEAAFFFPEDLPMVSAQTIHREKCGLSKVRLEQLPLVQQVSEEPKSLYALKGLASNDMFPYKVSVIGGTFDRLHSGHKVSSFLLSQILLSLSALLTQVKLYIGLTQEAMLEKKRNKYCIESYSARKLGLEQFFHFLSPRISVDISPLSDPVGVAGVVPEIEVLLVTTETIKGGNMVEEMRKKNNLPPVRMAVLDFGTVQVKTKISSTETRELIAKMANVDVGLLKGQWFDLVKDKKVAEHWWDTLLGCYSEDWRHYHTLNHVNQMLNVMKGLAGKVKNPMAFMLATWFHDAVYCPTRNDNEEMSVNLFMKFVKDAAAGCCAVDPAVVELVKLQIKATEKHEVDPAVPESLRDDIKLFLDADLAILGSETKEEYMKYAEGIRKEYSHYKPEEYKKGRSSVLNSFLEKSYIYLTPEMKGKLETRALENILSELDFLQHSA